MSAAIYVAVQRAKEIEKEIQEFYDTINRLLQWVPDTLAHLIEPIVEGLKWLGRKVSEFWAKIRPYLEVTGDPEKLERYATVLVDKVAAPLGDIAGDIAPAKLETNTEWTGTGAEAYKAVLPAQGDNLEGLRDLATELGNTLQELAIGIENFWWAMGLAYLALAIGVAGAIAEVVSVAGAPLSIPTVAGAVGVALAAITTAAIELKNIYDTVDVSQDKIKQGIVQLGDEWAKATPKNQARIDRPDNWRPIDGPARPPKVPVLGPTPPGDQLPPPVTAPTNPPSLPGAPPPGLSPVTPPTKPPSLPGVPPPPGSPPVTPPTNPPSLPGVPPPTAPPPGLPPVTPPPFTEPVPPPIRTDPGPVPPPGLVPPPDDIDPGPVPPPIRIDPVPVPPPATPPPGGIGIGPPPGEIDFGTSPSSVTSPAAGAGSGAASMPGLGGTQQPVSGGLGLSQAGGFTGAAKPTTGGPVGTAAGGATPASGRQNQGGPAGFPFGGMGAGKGGEDQTHTNKWRVQGQLFDDPDDAASFTGVVGKDPANDTKKR